MCNFKTYQQFLDTIRDEKILKLEYYQCLIKFRQRILTDIFNTNQQTVANKLGIHQTKLSAISSILKALPNTMNDTATTEDMDDLDNR
jgi:hypothetical protein